MCMLRQALLLYSYVIVICCLDVLCFPYRPLLPSPVLLPPNSLACLGHVGRQGMYLFPLHGAVENGKLILSLRRHGMTISDTTQVAGKQSPPIGSEEELTDRLFSGARVA